MYFEFQPEKKLSVIPSETPIVIHRISPPTNSNKKKTSSRTVVLYHWVVGVWLLLLKIDPNMLYREQINYNRSKAII